jgi:hypothetical protein
MFIRQICIFRNRYEPSANIDNNTECITLAFTAHVQDAHYKQDSRFYHSFSSLSLKFYYELQQEQIHRLTKINLVSLRDRLPL